MTESPDPAERLLATSPERFVEERTALARALRAENRVEEAKAVAAMRKPPAVVLAANGAARDRPAAARNAAEAADVLVRSQLEGDTTAYANAKDELHAALDLLAQVALAHLAREGKPATEAMRERVRSHLRAAVSDPNAREALVRGVLTEEMDTSGFDVFAGVPLPTGRRATRSRTTADRTRAEKQRQAERKKLQVEIDRARARLRDAESELRSAERERDAAAAALAELETRMSELSDAT